MSLESAWTQQVSWNEWQHFVSCRGPRDKEGVVSMLSSVYQVKLMRNRLIPNFKYTEDHLPLWKTSYFCTGSYWRERQLHISCKLQVRTWSNFSWLFATPPPPPPPFKIPIPDHTKTNWLIFVDKITTTYC